MLLGDPAAGPSAMSALNERIVESIAATGCYVGESLIDTPLMIALRGRLRFLLAARGLHAAQVGRAGTLTTATRTRGDSIAWLDTNALDPAESCAMALIDTLRHALNEALYVGAVETECHYAHYPTGAFYRPHLDRFGNHDLRVVSLVFYLNAQWRKHQGGELLIHHPSDGTVERVLPCSGTMVAFLSARFPHEVLPATRPRLALTGWMRRRALAGQ